MYVRSAHASMVLRGSTAYQLMSTVSPHLTGEHTVAELCDGLPQPQATAVTNLVQALLDRGMARDFQHEREASLPAAVTARFATQIAFLGHFVDDPVARFRRFRAARVLLVGAGHALHALGTGLLDNGLATVRLTAATAVESQRTALAAAAEPLAAMVVVADTDDVAGLDLVVYCADDADLAQVRTLAERCRQAGVRFLPAVLRGRRAVLGPLGEPGPAACWLCAQLRMTANDPVEVAADTWRGMALGRTGTDPSTVTEVVARMMGNAAAFDAFRQLTGVVAPDTAGAVLVQDTVTLESSISPVRPHPHCPVCAGTRTAPTPAGAEPDAGARATASDEEHYRRLSTLVDPTVGVFGQFTDDELRQSPLPTARLRVGPPTALVDGGREFVAFDIETVLQARLGTLRTALGFYADRMATVEVRQQPPAGSQIAPDRLDTWAGLSLPDSGWIRGTSLLTNEDRYVPAAAVFPYTQANRDRAYDRTPAGVGVGPDTDAVTTAGLRSALAYRALDALVRGQVGVAALDPAGLGADGRLGFLRDCLGHLGHRVVLRLVDGDGPVPVVLAALADTPGWHVGYGASRLDAAGQALRNLLGVAQFTAAGDGSAPDLGDPLFTGLPLVIEPTRDGVPAERDPLDRAALLDAVAATGDAIYVATTPYDLAETNSYLVGRVLLSR
ncbi:hypothetical protein GCM10027290_03060 [Micromonospora sonneratiae]|uniref:TOMM leader peptide-binding protein n=1 Tax=Micromonospora sonneratiae TaxID=1184706 RepID=A0ABW3Y8C5_9ACTN